MKQTVEQKSAKKVVNKETIEVNTTMSVIEFGEELVKRYNLGQNLALEHREKWGVGKTDPKAGKRFHAPGTDKTCSDCIKIADAMESYMRLQAEQIGITGIDLNSLLSAIKITRATVLMMKNGGELTQS